MRHLLLPYDTRPGDTVRLASADAHYLTRVLRLSPGDRFDALDAGGCLYVLRILGSNDDELEAVVEQERRGRGAAAASVPVTLCQAIPKGNRFADIVRQAVQAGVTRIIPLLTERTVVRPDQVGAERARRWDRVAREAVQQSGAVSPVTIDPPVALPDLQPAPDAVALVLHERPIAQVTLHSYLERVPRHVELVVGPEGGFSPREVETLLSRGFQPLYLGPRVFRTETAAIFALGAVQILVQEHDAWQPTE